MSERERESIDHTLYMKCSIRSGSHLLTCQVVFDFCRDRKREYIKLERDLGGENGEWRIGDSPVLMEAPFMLSLTSATI